MSHWDALLKRMVSEQFIAEDEDIGHVKSIPPISFFLVTNIYVEPVTKKLIVEYNDTPTPPA